MISTDLKRVKIQDVVESQLPAFVREDFPLINEFIKQYYISQEYPGAPVDLIQNIDEYLKLEALTNNSDYTELSANVSFSDTTINIRNLSSNDISGFPEKYGLIQIDDEIILYTEKTATSFTGCVRGFSGVKSYTNPISTDTLTFSTSEIAEHQSGAKVTNLSALLFNEFLKKIKYQFTPGFDNRQFDSDLNDRLFISRAKDFYQTKGTDASFQILFGALYGERVEVIKPSQHLFRPSDAEYRITKDIVVESISGNPLQLLNRTLFQDEYSKYNINKAYASITDVEKLSYGGKEYYKLSVDFDYSKDITVDGSILGEFSAHPKTKVINSVSAGSSIIDVDSTISFPKTGELVVKYSSGTIGIVSYTSKSINQFFGVSNVTSTINSKEDIRLNVYAYGYVGIGTTTRVDLRIGSVLSETVFDDNTYYYSKNDTGNVKSLGITTSSPKTNCWIYNVSVKYDVKTLQLVDTSDFTYRVVTYTKHNFQIGDNLSITDSTSVSKNCYISDIIDSNSFSIKGQGFLNANGFTYTIQRKITKPEVSSTLNTYSYLKNYTANVQNTYAKFNQDLLVASSSLPNYYNQPLNFYDKKITLNGSYSGETFTVPGVSDHGYYTGDAVYYTPYSFTTVTDEVTTTNTSKFANMQAGVYYVKRLENPNQFKLASSQANLYNNNFISVSGIVTANTLESFDFYNKKVEHQNLLREIKSPVNKSGNYITNPGTTGILINGVEVLNYKSEDVVYYGKINDIEVSAKGKDYDIINPPILSISDKTGKNASATCSVKGVLERIDIIDPGFDYISKPIITITGGNGYGAKADVNTKFIDYSVSFNATSESAFVNLTNGAIGFSTYHKFRNAEKIVYKTDGQKAVSGLTTDSVYYVRTIDASTVKLYKTESDAISGLNTISLTSYGVGVHRLQSFEKKQIVSNIVVVDSGTNYQNNRRIVSSSGIKTESNQINIIDHHYQSGDIVQYSFEGTKISGLTSSTSYVVTKVDDNNFKLSSVGVGSTSRLFYFETEQFVTLKSSGSGNHVFNYEPISVSIIGEIGVTTFAGQDFNAKVQPVFRGQIESAQITDSGVGYGSSEIINYNRQPLFTLSSGSSAELLPIIENGRIVEVLVTNEGSGYNSPPDLLVSGAGNYAKLTPIIKDGKIKSIRIESPGSGYADKTRIDVIPSGSGASFAANIQRWTVNLFQKNLNILSNDDGILNPSRNEQFGIEYTHLYAPRKLRESIYSKDGDNQIKYGVFDLQKINGEEVASQYHSPIIGWAYDGNPIYGPYGYSTKTGGNFRAMKSGYELIVKTNRPPFPSGFFVEDYEFKNNGDLDEHNGRFCITPDYPNGVYAYFATINPGSVENSTAFNKYKIPVFPYLIGNSFKSKPNEFNYDKNSNQVEYDLNTNEWFRNTTPYSLTENNSYYDFLFQPNKFKDQTINIDETSRGSITSVGILTGGTNYKVNDIVIFDTEVNSNKAKAKVSKILGKIVTNVSVATTTVSELEITSFDSNGTYVAFSTDPHGFLNNDLVSLSGFNTSVNYINNSFNIGVKTEKLILSSGVGTAGITGIVTYFNIFGNLTDSIFSIRENDILSIGSEKIKVLQVDPQNSRLRVLRSQQNTVSSAHTASTEIVENPRKFTFNSLPENEVKFEINREIYFNPQESLGVGTVSGVGIGTTIYFSNPGSGSTQIFIPTRSIYLKNHKLNTGDVLTYHTNGSNPITVMNDSLAGFALSDFSTVYVGKISNDLIGISTYKIGIGSTGTFVGIASTTSNTGLLYFTGIGTGVYHSFKTVKQNVVLSEANKNTVTVATASTHGLLLGDKIFVEVNPGITTSITVKYDDYNRRIVFNPKSFVTSDVDIINDIITINDHGFVTGDKVIYTSASPVGGLSNEQIYFVIRFTKDKIKLSNSRFEALQFNPTIVDLTSTSSGTLSLINPSINVYRNNTVKFDLSDSSLSSLSGSTLYPAFELNLYEDSEFKNSFDSSGKNNYFEVSKVGSVGITTNASVSLKVTNDLPKNLYYKFNPINTEFVSPYKNEIYIDTEVLNYNQIQVTNSFYSGEFVVAGVGTTSTFNYNLIQKPEKSSYNFDEGELLYSTTSTNAFGAIKEVDVTYGGSGYSNVVGVATVKSSFGSGAILNPSSDNIGKIIANQIEDIGFDYPTDKTLRPVCNLAEILTIEPLSSFREIGITSAGKGYTIAPKLVVVDGYTGKVVNDVDLSYKVGDTKVKILKNTFGIYNVTPKIIPTNNQNGIGINSIRYNTLTKEVSVGLNTGFSDSFPFSVGDKVLIENISVGVGSTGLGYNSSNYNYALFTLTKVPAGTSALGGSVGVVTYSLDGYLKNGQTPGNFDALNSSGRIIAEKDFPVFDIKLTKNDYILGETVVSGDSVGQVESWNNQIEVLKVSTTKDFKVGDIVVGQTSRTQGAIKQKIDFNCEIRTDATSIVKKGWNREAGFLNYNTERISDNNYYQNFSYSIKSKVSFDTWNDAVSALNHTSGFLKFSDLIIESNDSNFRGVYSDTRGSSIDIVVDIYGEKDINCYPSFDLVTENSLLGGGSRVLSDEIYFNSRVLTDYYESFGNRVLVIDDISTQFNSNPRPTRYSVVDLFNINHRTKKYFTYVRDKLYTGERQFLIVSLLQDGVNGFLNQYGRVESQSDLGSFDFNISGTEGQLLFYPTKYAVNNYNVSFASFDINDSFTGIGSTNLGDVVNIKTSQTTVSAGTTATIVSFGSTYRSSKVLLEIRSTSGQYEVDELNILHDNNNVEVLEYGQLTNHSLDAYSSIGLGTYNAYISSGNVKIDFIPNVGIAATVNAIIVSIASTLSTGIGTQYLGFDSENIAFLDSSYTSISSSPTPSENIIAKYSDIDPNDHNCSHYLVSVEDTTNNRYEMSEVVVLNDSSTAYITEYGNIVTHSGLGTVGAAVSSNYVNLYYTPLPNIDVQVRVFQTSLQLVDLEDVASTSIQFINGAIEAGFGFYEGTETDVKRAFELKHRQKPIFLRNFDGSNSSVVDVADDSIILPDHFFVTGEEVEYSYNIDNASPIGIASTSFVGVGTTSLLPSSVYIIKVSDQKVKLSRSAEDALKTIPVALDITSVGVGTYHTFTSKNQNTKCIVALDNYIQSPIVATSVTTGLTTHIGLTDSVLKFSGITSFFGGDLIQIDNEIMKINTVGLGSTNFVLVDRQWMGTGIATHSEYSVVTKIQGNYNIVDNTINFVTAPQGPIPIGSSTNPPDERDWTGITTFSKFQGRAFLRSGVENSTEETYTKNYVFDDISQNFNAITKTFTLTSDEQNITGFSTNNSVILINGIFQGPTGQLATPQDYSLTENSGITSITFTGTATSVSYDPNNANIPIGGKIISVGSTGGFGYQPLVSAGGTAVVSISGTISSVSIGNSGSGYRVGIQTTVRVGVATATTGVPSIFFIGTAAISGGHIVSVAITNPGTGYTSTNPPQVIFDSPLSYSDIPLIYSTSSSGFGTQATVDIVVGQGSSVIDFEIKNLGYNYRENQILTIASGGTSGIPTDPTKSFSEFQLTIEKTISDEFAGWNLGELEVLDEIDNQFDGIKKSFTISKNSSPLTIRSAKGSNIDVQATLLIFINDVLQIPGEAYTFTGGSVITFSEAPKGPSLDGISSGDNCKLLFYKGSGDIDVVFRDVLETVKEGDNLTIEGQEERLVTSVISSDTVETNPYDGEGIDSNPSNKRSVTWCKQTTDKIINGQIVSKSRVLNEALINPTTNVIQPVGVGSTIAYVESVKSFFNSVKENQTTINKQKIVIVSQDSIVGASASVVVSAAGTISEIIINNGGSGYVNAPSVIIGNPIGFGTTARATASSTISVGGTVATISVTSPGLGYTSTNPPQVLIEIPEIVYEINTSDAYYGDFGSIVGFGTTTVGNEDQFIFDLYIPINSFLRDTSIVSTAVTVSSIDSGDYFVISNSNVGFATTSITSLRIADSTTIGIGTQFVDNVYQVDSASTILSEVIGIGTTYVRRIYTPITSSGVGTVTFSSTLITFDSTLFTMDALSGGGSFTGVVTTFNSFGDFSWGKINLGSRTNSQTFNFYGLNGISGISTSAVVSRVAPLKSNNYL